MIIGYFYFAGLNIVIDIGMLEYQISNWCLIARQLILLITILVFYFIYYKDRKFLNDHFES